MVYFCAKKKLTQHHMVTTRVTAAPVSVPQEMSVNAIPPLTLEPDAFDDFSEDDDETENAPCYSPACEVDRIELGSPGDDKKRKRSPSYKGWKFTVSVSSLPQVGDVAMSLARDILVKYFSYRTTEGGAIFVVDFIVPKRISSLPRFDKVQSHWAPVRLSKKVISEIIGTGPGVWSYGSRAQTGDNENTGEPSKKKKKIQKCDCPVAHDTDCASAVVAACQIEGAPPLKFEELGAHLHTSPFVDPIDL